MLPQFGGVLAWNGYGVSSCLNHEDFGGDICGTLLNFFGGPLTVGNGYNSRAFGHFFPTEVV